MTNGFWRPAYVALCAAFALAVAASSLILGPATSASAAPPLTLSTTAPANAAIGDSVHDVAVVNGTASGDSLVFTLYRSSSNDGILDCSDGGTALAAVPVTDGVNTNAQYASPNTNALSAGTYGFAASILDTGGNVIATSDCQDELFLVQDAAQLFGQAKQDVEPGGFASDLVAVFGGPWTGGLNVVFRGYLESQDEIDNLTATCDAAHLFVTSGLRHIEYDDNGSDEDSGDVPVPLATPLGAIYWSSTVTDMSGNLIGVTECGLTEQTQILALPTLMAAPPGDLPAGTTAHNTMTVNGWNDFYKGDSLSVRLYKATSGAPLDCTTGGVLLSPVPLIGGDNTNQQYLSPETTALSAGEYSFVASIVDFSGHVVAVTDCEAGLFTVTASPDPPAPSPLAPTGVSISSGLVIGLGGILSGAAFALWAIARRRRARPRLVLV
jgi:hypothetical protein